ncbi:diacylglycerol kinase family protein [uncultured Mucilaginibacter sp.]|uniref:diacylglycerol/lipid kinase family protein n=1 Tax=uncultured Mucilaginibacter sp. TaxID=797541 RepID=UPI0025F7A248|nr:diacylglycerol kinase family protein [uncultured Mucilaginibacter sp.]
MRFKNVHVIINPATGKTEPVLSFLNDAFKGIKWEATVITPGLDAFSITKKLIGKTELIVVYGGDGSLSEVAGALCGTDTPMAIIPGGTANVMSKELGIPQDSRDALALIVDGPSKIMTIDMGIANNMPFLLRINLGMMADMVLLADDELKDNLGQMAYGVAALQTWMGAEPIRFGLLIDGEQVIEEGVSLTVTNAGNIGIGHFSFLPDMSVNDGFLDVILLNDADLLSVLRVAGTTLLQTESNVLKHWKCKQVSIFLEKSHSYVFDDCEKHAAEIHINILPGALKVLIPYQHNN